MTFEAALTAKIAATAGLTALVGARVYPDAAPEGVTGDYLVYQLQNRDDLAVLDGTTNTLVKDTVELTPYGVNRLAVAAIRDAIFTAFNGVAARGTWGGAGGLAVRSCVVESASADRDAPADGSETGDRLNRVTMNVFWQR